MSLSILKLVSTSTEVNLINTAGIYLIEWEPAFAPAKGGGTFLDSPLADNKTMVDRRLDNIVDTFRLAIVGTSKAAVITRLNSLTAILEEAVSFYTNEYRDWSNSIPGTYLECRFDYEASSRYTLIRNYSIEKLPNLHEQTPFNLGASSSGTAYASALIEIVLVIEHGHWLSQIPGASSAVSLANTYTFNSKTYGQAATSTDVVYIANGSREANLTHIYWFDASSSSWSSNLVNAALPHNLLPSTPAAGDIVYFGVATATVTTTFDNLVFDLDGTYGNNITSGIWEYRSSSGGGTWVGFSGSNHRDTTSDGSLFFNTSGICSLHFIPQSDWTTNTINGVAARWIRFRVLTVAGSPAPPRQQNRIVYTASKPYITVSNNSLGGDIAPLIKLDMSFVSISHDQVGTINPAKIIGGLRSTWRGDTFDAFLNYTDSQGNVASASDAAATFTNLATAPTGRAIVVDLATMATTNMTILATHLIATPDAADYHGKFRLLLRCQIPVAEFYWQIGVAYAATTTIADMSWVSRSKTNPTTAQITIIDFGLVDINTNPYGYSSNNLQISVAGQKPSGGTGSAYIIDAILIPVDEWSFAIDGPWALGNIVAPAEIVDSYIEINDTLETDVMCALFDNDNDMRSPWRLISPGLPRISHLYEQRLWLINTNTGDISSLWNHCTVTLGVNKRYLSLKAS